MRKYLSLSFYTTFWVGVAAGILLFLIFSMLVMARRQDEDQDRLETKLRWQNHLVPQSDLEGSTQDISGAIIPEGKIVGSRKPMS